MTNNPSETQLKFRFDSRLVTLLGEQSVSNSIAAVFELVKNGYDGDASRVEVIFHIDKEQSQKTKVTQIEVKDDGIGMTYEDIENKWMVVGTDIKEREILSPILGRRVVGEKGIGRFATQRLGSKLTLISHPKIYSKRLTNYPGKKVTVEIDWEEYQPGVMCDTIGNQVYFDEKDEPPQSGLTLIIKDLKDNWDENMIRDLNERLGQLVLPDELKKLEKESFDAVVIAPSISSESLKIEPVFLQKAPWAIKAHLKDDKINYQILKGGDIIKDTRTSYDPIPCNEEFDRSLECGEATFRLYFYPRGKDKERTLWKEYYKKALGRSKIDDILDKFAGVKIYNNNIQIQPYGNQGNDWLGLSKKWVKYASSSFRGETVIGFIHLSRERNPGIKETTTREGLIENTSFKDLRDKFAWRVIGELRSYINENTPRPEPKKPITKIRSKLEQLQDIIEDYSDQIPEDVSRSAKNLTDSINRQTNAMQKEFEEQLEEHIDEERLYQHLASIGITTISFTHEIMAPMSTINIKVNNLIDDIFDKKIDNDLLLKSLRTINHHSDSLLHWAQYIRSFGSILATPANSRKELINLQVYLNDIFSSFKQVINERKIEVSTYIPEYLHIYIDRADLDSIIQNLFTNAVKSLKSAKTNKKKIKVSVIQNNSQFTLVFNDTGIGIPPTDRERIFEPLYTTYHSKTELKGTGMGLPIIRELLEKYNGTIEVDQNVTKGASFIIKIPWKEVKPNE